MSPGQSYSWSPWQLLCLGLTYLSPLSLNLWDHPPSPFSANFTPTLHIHSYVRVCMLGTQSCPTPFDLMDCSPPGFSVQGIFPASILEQISISASRDSSKARDRTHVSCISCIGGQNLYHGATWEAPPPNVLNNSVYSEVFQASRKVQRMA